MAADSTVFLRRDPDTKQWVTVPLADAVEDCLFYFSVGSSTIYQLYLDESLTIGSGTLAVNWDDNPGNHANVTVTSTPLTLDSTHSIVVVSNGSAITLPDATTCLGRKYNVIRSGTSNVAIGTTAAQTISGDTSLTLTNQWDSVVMVSDGSNWVRCS